MVSRIALALVVLSGCASTIEPNGTQGTRYVDVVVSDQWSPEETEAVLKGVDFWTENLSANRYTVLVTVAPCDVDTGDVGCIAPVSFEHPALRENEDGLDNGRVVGSCMHGVIAMWEDMPVEDLDVLTAHELGHYLGLGHDDTPLQIMAPRTGEMAFALTASAEAYLQSL